MLGKHMNLFILEDRCYIVSISFLYKGGLNIKLATKADLPLIPKKTESGREFW